MLLQSIFENFSHSVSAQGLIKYFHICRHNVQHRLCFSATSFVVWRSFQLSSVVLEGVYDLYCTGFGCVRVRVTRVFPSLLNP